MGKKKPGRKPQPDDKVPFQVRLDSELHELLTKAAEKLEISVNQLVQSLCWGAIQHFEPGEGSISPSGFVRVTPRRKCGFVGKPGTYRGSPEEIENIFLAGHQPEVENRGEFWFGLDFSERGVVKR